MSDSFFVCWLVFFGKSFDLINVFLFVLFYDICLCEIKLVLFCERMKHVFSEKTGHD